MDAHAHLLSLGWAGPGHALDSRPNKAYKQTGKRGLDYDPKQATNTGVGLVKPLMISQRKDRFGIGKKDPKYEPAQGQQWWLKGFEAALNNIGKSDSERSGTVTPTQALQARVNGQKHQDLYGYFVKGKEMEGSIGRELLKKSKKRKSDQISGNFSQDENERGASSDDTKEFALAAKFMTLRDKDEKRRARAEKAGASEEFAQATEFFELSSDRKKNKKRESQVEASTAEVEGTIGIAGPCHEETKEERQERRRKRKEEKVAGNTQEAKELQHGSSTAQDDTSKRKAKHDRRRQTNLKADRC